MRKAPTSGIPLEQLSAVEQVHVDPHQLLATLISSAPMGVGIWDRRLRFRLLNNALASMNGYSAKEHLGKPLYKMIGAVSEKVAPAREHVFRTGELLRDMHYAGLLPTRTEMGHWIETSFPCHDRAGKIVYVGAIVLEVTQIVRLQDSVEDLGGTLRAANQALRSRPLPRSASLKPVLRRSISQVRAISDFLTPTLLENIVGSLCGPLSRFAPGARVEPVGVLPSPPRETAAVPLSFREQQVLRLLASGKINKEIAAALGISTRTVETHRARIMLKLDMHSVAQLVHYAIGHKLIG